MDVVFHCGAAALLAYGLGERRPRLLAAAGALGLAPDLLWLPSELSPGWALCYTLPHSLLFNAALCAAVAALAGWRIAGGPLLHIFIDSFAHASSTRHLLYPFAEWRPFAGIDWWHGRGLFLWAGLWLLLVVVAVITVGRRKAAAALQRIIPGGTR